MTKTNATVANPWSAGLVGRCFHTFHARPDGTMMVQCQGIVRAKIEDELYLVQYFEWAIGPNTAHLVRLADMLDWQFYEDHEHMNFWYEYQYRRPAKRLEAEAA